MAGFNYGQNIIGLNKIKGDIHELEVDVANLSASVLTIAGDVDELELSVADLSASVLAIGGEVDELELSISQLSASTLPYSSEETIKEKIDEKGTVNRVRGRNGLTGDVTNDGYIETSVPRVNKDANVTPIPNAIIWEEYINESPNIPTQAFYIIETISGSDPEYAVQVAYGLNADNSYYRNRKHGTWGSWIKLTP